VTVPAALQSHFLAENARTQLVFFAKMDESDAGALQLFDQLHHVGQRLVLHRHHSDEHLIALHLEATFRIRHFHRRTIIVQKRV
jgi:hypothetical protein